VPVYLVPGNHERSRIPLHLWASHPDIHIFDRPKTFHLQVRDRSITISGFPYVRDIRNCFPSVVKETGHEPGATDSAILCMHQAFEGARVGEPGKFRFRNGRDVVRGLDLPNGLDAVFTGHIYHAQILRADTQGRPLAAPVIYPGLVERTSWAEQDEPKGYVIITVGERRDQPEMQWTRLPAWPMCDVYVDSAPERQSLEVSLATELRKLQRDAVVRLHLRGAWSDGAREALASANLRRLAADTMNISLHRGAMSSQPRREGPAVPVEKQG
jgi:DNA repair exonuclease SbcCD nuclease subunit